ncbi:MAG TPA: response regulator [Acidimicrobiia bacterium]|nr:response regulator [Acidimicrobiia bacterium]
MAPATVLVVDDDPVILKLLEVNFEMEGFEVVRAADGFEGLERARAVRPDIVVLDVMMPRMTGYEVAKALREDEDTAHIPIIFVTARAQSTDVERGMELGVDDYVTKPFDPLDLIARVNALLARRQGHDGGGAPPASEEPAAAAAAAPAPLPAPPASLPAPPAPLPAPPAEPPAVPGLDPGSAAAS